MVKCVSILGSTGSIGRQALDVISHMDVRVAALTAGTSVERMAQQCREFVPELAVMATQEAAQALQLKIQDLPTRGSWGEEGLNEAATLDGVDCVITAVVGMLGLKPTLAAIRAGKRKEIFEMCVYGLRRVIPAEIQNEALDYCEWKNGYRSEAMLGVTQSLISKIQQAVMGGVTNIVMGKIGYIQGLEIGTQTDKTKWWIFALGTGIPIITSSLGIIPKLFYPLSAETRERMYADLQERRAAMAEFMKTATKEEIDAMAEKQLQGQFE